MVKCFPQLFRNRECYVLLLIFVNLYFIVLACEGRHILCLKTYLIFINVNSLHNADSFMLFCNRFGIVPSISANYKLIMEIQIKVIKVLPNESKELYRNTINVPVGVLFPYDAMIDSLRWLYPACLYQFNIM